MMMDVSKQMGDKALNRCYMDNIRPGSIGSGEIGVKFGKIRPMPLSAFGPHLPRRRQKASRAAPSSSRKLLAACAKRGIEIRYEHKAIELLRDEHSAVTGVRAATPEGVFDFAARAASASRRAASANPEMVCRATSAVGRPAWCFAAPSRRRAKTFRSRSRSTRSASTWTR